MTCPVCHGSGDAQGLSFYDCAAPGCTAAVDRANLDAAIALLPPMVKEDVNWAAYNAGRELAEKRWALERAELVRQLRAMWGYAIELDADCISGQYFDAEGQAAACGAMDEWKAATRKALVLLQTYKDDKQCK